jgi:hypothetical protein
MMFTADEVQHIHDAYKLTVDRQQNEIGRLRSRVSEVEAERDKMFDSAVACGVQLASQENFGTASVTVSVTIASTLLLSVPSPDQLYAHIVNGLYEQLKRRSIKFDHLESP